MFEKAWESGLGLTIGLTLIFIIVMLFLYYKAVRKRQIFLTAFAEELGFEYEKFVHRDVLDSYSDFDLVNPYYLKLSLNISFENRIWGREKALDIAMFEAISVVAEGETQRTTAVSICDENQKIPDFYFGTTSLLGFKNSNTIHLDKRAEDIAHYKLIGEDVEAINNLFDDDLVDFLVEHSTWHIDVKDNKMLCYIYAKRLKTSEYRDFLELSKIVYAHLCGLHKGEVTLHESL